MLVQLVLGVLLASTVSTLAYRLHSLSKRGAYGATFLGAMIFGLGGWEWAVLLLTFFVLSSALTHAFGSAKESSAEKYSKGGQRDAGQVLSNGGVAALFVLFHAAYPGVAWPWIAYAGALAAVNADTWATELGVLDPNGPRLIISLRTRVEKGTSGGISLGGTAASLVASFIIGLLASALFPPIAVATVLAVSVAGFMGSITDSLLGATVQGIYFCPADQMETERHPVHTCGTRTIQVRGWKWLNNDLVNAACGGVGAAAALVLGGMLRVF